MQRTRVAIFIHSCSSCSSCSSRTWHLDRRFTACTVLHGTCGGRVHMLQRKTKRRTQHSMHTRRDAMWAAEAARVRIDILNIPFALPMHGCNVRAAGSSAVIFSHPCPHTRATYSRDTFYFVLIDIDVVAADHSLTNSPQATRTRSDDDSTPGSRYCAITGPTVPPSCGRRCRLRAERLLSVFIPPSPPSPRKLWA